MIRKYKKVPTSALLQDLKAHRSGTRFSGGISDIKSEVEYRRKHGMIRKDAGKSKKKKSLFG